MNKLLIILIAILALSLPSCRKNKDPKGDQIQPGDQGTELWTPTFQPPPEPLECTELQINSILANTTAALIIDCNATLEPNQTITRKLIFQGARSSGVTFNCNDSTIGQPNDNILDIIEIRSNQTTNGTWTPVHDVTFRNCTVNGGIRVWGKGKNGSAETFLESSHSLQHVTNTRNSAPYHVVLENLAIAANDRIPVYFAPGVHHSALIESNLSGKSPLLYLDAESFGNNIEGNIFSGAVTREAIAIDGSASNVIRDNSLVDLTNGGIYLYRNCGEDGVIRHTTPSNNEISGNDIMHGNGIWPFNTNAGIYLGARDGSSGYCNDDAGYDYGSSISDQDHARFNLVSENELWGCTIETGNRTNHSNVVENNTIH